MLKSSRTAIILPVEQVTALRIQNIENVLIEKHDVETHNIQKHNTNTVVRADPMTAPVTTDPPRINKRKTRMVRREKRKNDEAYVARRLASGTAKLVPAKSVAHKNLLLLDSDKDRIFPVEDDVNEAETSQSVAIGLNKGVTRKQQTVAMREARKNLTSLIALFKPQLIWHTVPSTGEIVNTGKYTKGSLHVPANWDRVMVAWNTLKAAEAPLVYTVRENGKVVKKLRGERDNGPYGHSRTCERRLKPLPNFVRERQRYGKLFDYERAMGKGKFAGMGRLIDTIDDREIIINAFYEEANLDYYSEDDEDYVVDDGEEHVAEDWRDMVGHGKKKKKKRQANPEVVKPVLTKPAIVDPEQIAPALGGPIVDAKPYEIKLCVGDEGMRAPLVREEAMKRLVQDWERMVNPDLLFSKNVDDDNVLPTLLDNSNSEDEELPGLVQELDSDGDEEKENSLYEGDHRPVLNAGQWFPDALENRKLNLGVPIFVSEPVEDEKFGLINVNVGVVDTTAKPPVKPPLAVEGETNQHDETMISAVEAVVQAAAPLVVPPLKKRFQGNPTWAYTRPDHMLPAGFPVMPETSKCRTTFTSRVARGDLIWHDLRSDFYCGYLSILWAARKKLNDETAKMIVRYSEEEDDGKVKHIAKFASELGYNVAFFICGRKGSDGIVMPDSWHYMDTLAPDHPFIFLKLQNKHYYVGVSPVSSEARMVEGMKVIERTCDEESKRVDETHWWWQILRYRISFQVGGLDMSSDRDQRDISMARDPAIYHDELARVVIKESISLTSRGKVLAFFLLYVFCATFFTAYYYRVYPIFIVPVVILFWFCANIRAVPWNMRPGKAYRRELAVSVGRLVAFLGQIGPLNNVNDVLQSLLAQIATESRLNTPINYGTSLVVSDTVHLARLLARGNGVIPYGRIVTVYDSGAVKTAAMDLTKVLASQVVMNNCVGHGKSASNGYARLPCVRLDEEQKPSVIAYAPDGTPTRLGEAIHPGHRPKTTVINVMAAASGRSQTGPDARVPDLLLELRAHAAKVFKPYVDATPQPAHSEQTETQDEAYRRHMRGKLKKSTVEANIELMRRYRINDPTLKPAVRRKMERCGMFVKGEDSSKRGKYRVQSKPRLIMTMSLVMHYDLCRLLDLIHAFNESPFAKYQVKNGTIEENNLKVFEAMEQPHLVTDYSSYEASITEPHRMVELDLLSSLCERFGFSMLQEALDRHCYGGRFINFKAVRFWIASRCSGDYYTSFGNGVLNFAIMTFCAEKNGVDWSDMKAVFEGDDAVVPANVPDLSIITDLGFKFSLAIEGTKGGDCDFCSARFVKVEEEILRILNIHKYVTSFFYVKTDQALKPSKIKWLWRCMGASLHHLSPGHPILGALVERIGVVTRGCTQYAAYEAHLDTWKFKGYDSEYPRNFRICHKKRVAVATGSQDFPPIPISAQLAIEESIRNGVYEFGTILDGSSSVLDHAEITRDLGSDDRDFRSLYAALSYAFACTANKNAGPVLVPDVSKKFSSATRAEFIMENTPTPAAASDPSSILPVFDQPPHEGHFIDPVNYPVLSHELVDFFDKVVLTHPVYKTPKGKL